MAAEQRVVRHGVGRNALAGHEPKDLPGRRDVALALVEVEQSVESDHRACKKAMEMHATVCELRCHSFQRQTVKHVHFSGVHVSRVSTETIKQSEWA